MRRNDCCAVQPRLRRTSVAFRGRTGTTSPYCSTTRRALSWARTRLGLFPLYYWAKGDVCMFGTSPELFKHHSSFVAEPSTYGIASVLLISHISNGQSLYKGVRRASSAHYVEWTPEGIGETEANPIRMSDASFDEPYETCLERVSSCLDTFHKSLASLPQMDLLLSGGQDSRTVAGYMDRHLPRKVGARSQSRNQQRSGVAVRQEGLAHLWLAASLSGCRVRKIFLVCDEPAENGIAAGAVRELW